MEMTSTRTVPAPVETVWVALNDPVMLTGCIPGCEAILPDGENAYRISMAAHVGPVAAKFSGRLELSDLDPPRSYTLSFDGQGGAAGFAKGQAKVALAPTENGAATALSYTVAAQVEGRSLRSGRDSWTAPRRSSPTISSAASAMPSRRRSVRPRRSPPHRRGTGAGSAS